jgi:hypothetical protein
VAEFSGTASPISEARLRALRILVACNGRARRAIVNEVLTQTDDGRPLSHPIGFLHNALAARLVEAGLAELEPSGEFVRITREGREVVGKAQETADQLSSSEAR